ncbi:histone H4 transcription factor-like [Mizuhopecten yessoensis]|uniref:Histone H4 transcription factor n=2 Tax=Mizuhopecten yessoensis TaxID=6573 RepID=A0A210Q7S3_MIZYE|nr:histone H4 transcription factor-like [Mizuhopecten yessoensis]OWF44797.1 Histone H4 transcription factor [Mizuhopecten yessoensis]
MPPKTKKRARGDLKIAKEDWTLPCEWGDCHDIFTEMELFLRHMSNHLCQTDTTTEDGHQCCWRECGTEVQGENYDFYRHVYFHSFHVKIKCIGSLLINKLGMDNCLLDTHTRNLIPELPERLQCGWHMCEAVVDNPEMFYRHVDNHADNCTEGKKSNRKNAATSNAKCEWEACDFVAENRWRLKEHLRSHTQEKVIACPTCGGLFSARCKFIDHVKRQAETEVQCYQCSHCNKRYSTERLLRDHVRHHVNQYKCPCCEMTCPTPSSLKSHLRYRHTNDKPFKCQHCEHSCKTAADLRKHMDSHSVEVPFRCHVPDCDYGARTYSSLSNHFKRTHQEVDVQKYACHVCKSVFSRGSKLTVHLKKRHKFRWPSGHSRFRYKLHEDGFWRLQTVRYESIQLTEQVTDDSNPSTDPKQPSTSADSQSSHAAGSAEQEQSESNAMETETEDTENNIQTLEITMVTNDDDGSSQVDGESSITYIAMPIELDASKSGGGDLTAESFGTVTDIRILSAEVTPGTNSSINTTPPLSETGFVVNIPSEERSLDKLQTVKATYNKKGQENDLEMSYNLEMLGYVAMRATNQTTDQGPSHSNAEVEEQSSPSKPGTYKTLRSEDL